MSSWKDRFSKISQRYVLGVLASLCLLLVVVVLAAGSRQADRDVESQAQASPPDAETILPATTWLEPGTGRMWAKTDNGSDIAQPEAAEYCRNLALAGFRDWRLPAIGELDALFDGGTTDGRVFIKGDIHLTSPSVWSSTRSPEHGQGTAWSLNFAQDLYQGSDQHFGPIETRQGLRALCVRAGKE
jgi:hypothetical protein